MQLSGQTHRSYSNDERIVLGNKAARLHLAALSKRHVDDDIFDMAAFRNCTDRSTEVLQ